MRLRRALGIALAASLWIAVATAIGAPRAGDYKGTNSRGLPEPVTFRVSSTGKDVLDFQPTFAVSCTKKGLADQSIVITTDVGTNLPIHKSAFKLRSTHARIHNGSVVYAIATLSVKGSFPTKHTARGTYSVSFTFIHSAPSGFGGYHCTTGKVQWTATHS
jgi:hypothetical protein